jgi:hypothetical protein
MTLGIFDAAGVVQLQLHRGADVCSVSDLLIYCLKDLKAIAGAKGGIRRLLDEKWTKVYEASASRGLFAWDAKRKAA